MAIDERDLLVSPSSIQIATGASSGGSSELRQQLAERGSRVIWEILRPYSKRSKPIAATLEGGNNPDPAAYVEEFSRIPRGVRLSVLELIDAPIFHVVDVWESTDEPRVYSDATKLTAGTDYVVADEGLRRIDSTTGQPTTWAVGWRSVRVHYLPGWLLEDVPGRIQSQVLQLVSMALNDRRRGMTGATQASDAAGSVSRINASLVTPAMRQELRAFRLPPNPERYTER